MTGYFQFQPEPKLTWSHSSQYPNPAERAGLQEGRHTDLQEGQPIVRKQDQLTPEIKVTKEHTWYAISDKWVLVQKLGIPNYNLQTTWNKRRMKTKLWMLPFFFEGGTKYSQEEIWGHNVEHSLRQKPSRDCTTWGSIPYFVTKSRHYCIFQQVCADKSLM